jgi:hypothetical protein
MPKIFTGPYARCQCCDKITPVRLLSVAGPVSVQSVHITRNLLNHVFHDVATAIVGDARTRKVRDANNPLGVRQTYTYYRFTCRQCYLKSKELYWVEASPGNWVGGWCKFCLHRHFEGGTFGHPEEGGDVSMPLISLTASTKTSELISTWNEEYHRLRGVDFEDPIPLAPSPQAARKEQLF